MVYSRDGRHLLNTLLQIFCVQVVLNLFMYQEFHRMCPPSPSISYNPITTSSLFLPGQEFYDICIIHAGLGGAVIAERYANLKRAKVLFVERQGFIQNDGGLDAILHRNYIANTSDRVWSYIESFVECSTMGCRRLNESVAKAPTQPKPSIYSDETWANSTSSRKGAEFAQRLLDHSLITNDNKGISMKARACGKIYTSNSINRNLQSPAQRHEESRLEVGISSLHRNIMQAKEQNNQHQYADSIYETVKQALTLFDRDTTTADVIVSRCQENMGWLRTLQERIPFQYVYIYNKCENNDTSILKIQEQFSNVHVISLPNVGREGATWLHHMLRTDIELAHHNIMLQGKAETKRSQLRSFLKSLSQAPNVLHFMDLSRHPAKPRARSRVCWSLNHFCARDYNFTELCDFCQTYSSTGRSCAEAIPTLRGEFYVSALAIRRNILARRPLFENLLDILNRENDPPFGHHLERCWGEVLSGWHE